MGRIIEAVGVSKDYATGGVVRRVLSDVSVSVERGDFLAVMGPSGSGKSTLLHVLGGIDRTHDGVVSVDGTRLDGCGDDALALLRRHAFGFVFQAFNLVPVLTVTENVSLPGLIAGSNGPASDRRVRDLLDLLGLSDRADQLPSELSGGEQQRVAIARALFLEPQVVLADEPTGNLDSASGAEVLDLLHRANTELGQTIVMVTHDPSAAVVADEVLMLRDGATVGSLRFATAEARQGRLQRLTTWLQDATLPPMRQGRPTRPLVAG